LVPVIVDKNPDFSSSDDSWEQEEDAAQWGAAAGGPADELQAV
jgi:hypothetical protein